MNLEQQNMFIKALEILGLNVQDEQLNISDVKKAYYALSKQFHPDVLIRQNLVENKIYEKKYLEIQKAYQFLIEYTDREFRQFLFQLRFNTQRKTKIISSNKQAVKQQRQQRDYQHDMKRYYKNAAQKSVAKPMDKRDSKQDVYQNAMDQINAVWIAEVIHRAMKEDKIKKEKEQRRKLYQAFMKYNENNSSNI